MTVRTRVRRMESTVGGASEYAPLELFLAATLADDPARRAKAQRAMKGRRLDPKTEALLISLANWPDREAGHAADLTSSTSCGIDKGIGGQHDRQGA